MTIQDIDWTKIGQALAENATAAHDGVLPPLDVAYSFLLDNPECFSDHDEWPADMPKTPPAELDAAYHDTTEEDSVNGILDQIRGLGLELQAINWRCGVLILGAVQECRDRIAGKEA